MIRLTIPSIEEDDLQAVRKVLTSGYLIQGSTVAAFEQQVAAYVRVQHAVAVSSGTAALHMALLALDVRLGDLVVVTAYSWPATANVIELCGAQPVFVDIDANTFNLDPHSLEQVLERLMTSSQTALRVKAIMVVHTFGQMADMPAILKLAEYYQLPVIEDAACALGATLRGKQAGSWGQMGCFSFHPRKAITTGEGGMITGNVPDQIERLRALRNHGLAANTSSSDFIMPGFNYRLTEFQAALGLTQMAKLDRIITARRRLASNYTKQFIDSPVQPPFVAPGNEPVYQSYVVLLSEQLAPYRSKLIEQLKEDGIETTIGTWHIPLTTYFRARYGYQPGDFPVTDAVFARSLTLPLYEQMGDEEQARVINTLGAVIK